MTPALRTGVGGDPRLGRRGNADRSMRVKELDSTLSRLSQASVVRCHLGNIVPGSTLES